VQVNPKIELISTWREYLLCIIAKSGTLSSEADMSVRVTQSCIILPPFANPGYTTSAWTRTPWLSEKSIFLTMLQLCSNYSKAMKFVNVLKMFARPSGMKYRYYAVPLTSGAF